MWRWPSKSFWWIKSALFVVFLPIFCLAAVVVFVLNGMRGTGPAGVSAPPPPLEQFVAWAAVTPVRPNESFPTDGMLLNLIFALGVNAILWSWVASLLVATTAHVITRLIVRGKRVPE
jgi:hypothetical protein